MLATRRTTTPPAPPGRRDCAAFVSDVTVPDGTRVRVGQHVTKTWRLRNCGNTDWSDLTAVRVSGSVGPESFPVAATAPGSTAEVGVSFTVPAGSGSSRSVYRLRAPDGHSADNDFWLQVHIEPGPTTPAAQPQPPPATRPAQPAPPPPVDGDIPPATDPGQDPLPANARQLGGVDLDRYCRDGWGLRAMLRFSNAWGWRCSPSAVPASGKRQGDPPGGPSSMVCMSGGAGRTATEMSIGSISKAFATRAASATGQFTAWESELAVR